MGKQRIAVVGAGISGLASAWLLGAPARRHAVRGGPTSAATPTPSTSTLEGKTHPVDTGFPRLQREDLPEPDRAVRTSAWTASKPRCPSRSAWRTPTRMGRQQSGDRLRAEAQPVAPQFWAMLSDILRFNRESTPGCSRIPTTSAACATSCAKDATRRLRRLVPAADGRRHLVVPDRPDARHAARHLRPLLPEPRLVAGLRPAHLAHGERGRSRIRAQDRRPARRHPPRLPGAGRDPRAAGLRVTHAGGSEHFDQVVMACHSDQALAILGFTASDAQREVLSAIRYQPNRAVLHTDRALLPRDEKLWSAWNYAAGSGTPGEQPVGVSYLINKPAAAALRDAGRRHAQPGARARSGQGHCRIRLCPPDLRRSGHRRPATPAEVQGEAASGWPAPGAATASTRMV
jgi:hypothetical protein